MLLTLKMLLLTQLKKENSSLKILVIKHTQVYLLIQNLLNNTV
jgi:hypothetical protein